MEVQVRLFAMMADRVRTAELTLSIPDGSSVAVLREAVQSRFPQMPWPPGTMVAVNQEYAQDHTSISPGDEVAVIPPVSGG